MDMETQAMLMVSHRRGELSEIRLSEQGTLCGLEMGTVVVVGKPKEDQLTEGRQQNIALPNVCISGETACVLWYPSP